MKETVSTPKNSAKARDSELESQMSDTDRKRNLKRRLKENQTELNVRELRLEEATQAITEKDERIDGQSRQISDLTDQVASKTKELKDVMKATTKKPPYNKIMRQI